MQLFSFVPLIDDKFTQILQKSVNDFISNLNTKLYSKESVSKNISEINIQMFGNQITKSQTHHIIKILEVIHAISIQTHTLWESDGSKQFKTSSSLGQMLFKTLDANYHSVQKRCLNLNKSGDRCTMNNPFVHKTHDHIFKCSPFHEFDSVSIHLVLCCLYNMLWAIEKNYDESIVIMSSLTGLYHDIGKPLTVEVYEQKRSLVTGFPAHAEIGSMLFLMHWCPEMQTFISKENYMFVCTTILRHMCGYHRDEDRSNSYKRDLLLLEKPIIRTLLSINRVGDHFGKLCLPGSNESVDHFFHQQHLFENKMNVSKICSEIKVLDTNNDEDVNAFTNPSVTDPSVTDPSVTDPLVVEIHFNNESLIDLQKILKSRSNIQGKKIRHDKICVFVIGTSHIDNSYFVNILQKQLLEHKITIVSYDECLLEYLSSSNYQSLRKQLQEDITRIHIIYQDLFHSPNEKQNDDIIIDPLSINWSEIFKQVSVLYVNKIQQAINDESEFIVMDSRLNCYPKTMETDLPKDLEQLFRVHVHVQSYLEIKESVTSSNTSSIFEQLKVKGPSGLRYPLDPRGFYDCAKNKKAFTSLSSEISTNGHLPKSTFASKFRPHLVAGICIRSDSGDHGFNETFECLKTLVLGIRITSYSQKNDLNEDNDVKKVNDVNEVNDVKEVVIEEEEQIPGVISETKDMNVKQLYEHLIKKFSGNRSMIREYLRTLGTAQGNYGFMHSCFLDKSMDSLQMSDKLAYMQKLSELSQCWKDNGIVTNAKSSHEFLDNRELYERYVNSIPVLKYYEQFGPRFWKNKFALEMRGTVLFVNPETNDVNIMIMKLPRGAEAVTGMISNSGGDTQDVKAGKINILDLEQQDTCTRLCKNQEINMYLTSKGDGSLLSISSFTGHGLKIMLPLVQIFGSDYAKLWASQSLKLTNGHRLLVPGTQGTCMEQGFMASYMVTAILVGSGITDRETLNTLNTQSQTQTQTESESESQSQTQSQSNVNYMTAWSRFGEVWIKKFLEFKFFDDLTETHTFSFEAICKDRCGLFGDRPHHELACLYPRDRLIFLGVSIADRRFYIPHPLYEENNWNVPFEQPLWWKINHALEVNHMMDDLELLILDKITKTAYLNTFKPSNKGFDPQDVKQIEDAMIDYEGWVAMKIATFPLQDPDHLTVCQMLGIPKTIYSKIKTRPYYKTHKFHMENIVYMTQLAITAGHIFPMARKVAGICAPGAMAQRLIEIGNKTIALLDFTSKDSNFMIMLKNGHILYCDNQLALGKPMPKNPFDDKFDLRSFDVKCRIAISSRGFNFGELLVPIYLQIFPEIDPNIPSLDALFSALTMELKPWVPGYETRASSLNVTSKCVQGLVTACIGTSLDITGSA